MQSTRSQRRLIGVLTPSSNTVLEPVTSAILSGVPGASAHFSRFEVTRIALSNHALAQFDIAPMLAAARLLADARVGVIGWSGTSASWLGFDRDEVLCRILERETGIAACTSVLALNALIDRHPRKRFGLVTPYTEDVNARIVANYAASGYTVVADARSDISDNFSFSEVPPERVAEMSRKVARADPDAVVIMCTNMQGAEIAPALEAELGIPVYDSTAAVVWDALRKLGVDTGLVKGWGRMFQAP